MIGKDPFHCGHVIDEVVHGTADLVKKIKKFKRMTVQPRGESSGQAKWITWVIRAAEMKAPSAVPTPTSSAAKSMNKSASTGEVLGRSAT